MSVPPSLSPGAHKNESIKVASRYLRGTLIESLADPSTGAIAPDDTQLLKFHGTYQQDDRDVRKGRRQRKLEPAYSFMIRVRVPGGVASAAQWLEMDRLATTYANSTLKLTTRQAFQFHGVIKSNLRTTIREINEVCFDTIAACGDVNRNVMCNPNPYQSEVHEDALKLAQDISDHLTPRTRAYHEIWLKPEDDPEAERIKVTEEPDEEPIYGRTYLPRKFKIVVAVPPSNDVDIYAHDLSFIAIVDEADRRITAYNVAIGGGMGMTHGNEATYPLLAQILGSCSPDQAVAVAEAVVRVQKEYGNRVDRANARLKYTLDKFGLAWFRNAVEERTGFKLGTERPFHFDHNGDRYGWTKDHLGRYHLTLFIQNGRVLDTEEVPMLTGLREIAKIHAGDFRLTANQNLIISNIDPANVARIAALLGQYNLTSCYQRTGLRLNSMACVALPTCGLSLAESERYLPDLVSELESVLERIGLADEPITIRMTGCPNGCARPYIAEIGLVGRGPNRYNLYLGGGFHGQRLNRLYRQDIKSHEILDALRPLFEDFAQNRLPGERFGDFTIRRGHIAEVRHGRDFHAAQEAAPA
jgi:sulfite reductase (NADPH) hemoprotein beta-component